MKSLSPPGPSAGAADLTSLTLLERVRGRDATAWQRLVDLYSPLIFSWCQRCGLGNEDSRDVLQEVFVAVAGAIDRFRRDRPEDTFRGWLRVIARNQIRLYFRREANRPQAVGGTTANLRVQELPDEDLNDSDSVDAQQVGELFRRGLELIRSEFEPRTWQAFWLSVVDDCPSAEVCSRLQMTAGAVRQAKYKVLRKLRRELGEVDSQCGPKMV